MSNRTRFALFITCLGLATLYLGLRLSPGLGPVTWPFLLSAVGLLFVFPLSWRRRKNPSVAATAFKFLVYIDMGFLSFLGALVIIRDLVFFPFTWLHPDTADLAFGSVGSTTLLGLTIGKLVVGWIWAGFGPRIKNVELKVRDLPSLLDGFRIAQISDLHIGPTIGRSYVDDVVKKVNALNPDLTVLTGDIGDGDLDEHREDTFPLGEIAPAGRVFFVMGNHEYYWNGPAWIQRFEQLGMIVLQNSNTIVEHHGGRILVAGVVDPAARMVSPHLKPDVRAARGDDAIPTAFKILLSHHPGVAREAAQLGFDLQLSGHTHAGQFFPWTLVVKHVHEFHKGLDTLGGMWIYVNPGTGSWGPPIRLGTTPEITLLTLKKA